MATAGSGKPKVGLFDALEGREFEGTNGALHVRIAGASTGTGMAVPITFGGDVCEEAGASHTEATSGSTVIHSAGGSGVDTEVRYFSIWNQSTDSRLAYRLELGSEIVARGGLAPMAGFNANLIGAYHRATNQPIQGWIEGLDGSVSAVWSVRFKEY